MRRAAPVPEKIGREEETRSVEISDMTAVSVHPQLLNDNDTNSNRSSGSTDCRAQSAIVHLKLLLSFVKTSIFPALIQCPGIR
ncbi:hypothetical protein Q7C36_022561 [Tachysurus vachellii]|uniref:Uncharacterized protein n=1 Tax=Tachysurus vachellii TaxID=175792 RepID=A0AA88ILR0_TACVA|nr:hypothetical protein Q7C36_022561 [Tachysurus vachellii]